MTARYRYNDDANHVIGIVQVSKKEWFAVEVKDDKHVGSYGPTSFNFAYKEAWGVKHILEEYAGTYVPYVGIIETEELDGLGT